LIRVVLDNPTRDEDRGKAKESQESQRKAKGDAAQFDDQRR
jgi:hypothetical protein